MQLKEFLEIIYTAHQISNILALAFLGLCWKDISMDSIYYF